MLGEDDSRDRRGRGIESMKTKDSEQGGELKTPWQQEWMIRLKCIDRNANAKRKDSSEKNKFKPALEMKHETTRQRNDTWFPFCSGHTACQQ